MKKIALNKDNRQCLSLIWNRAQISREGKLIKDKKAEQIAEFIDCGPERIKSNRFTAMFLGIRASIMDTLTERYISIQPDCKVLHLGCGLDSRYLRLKNKPRIWYDLDFPEVINLRRNFYEENDRYRMLDSDVTDFSWLRKVADGGHALVIAEGLTMFLTADENVDIFVHLSKKFSHTEYIFDAYTDKVPVLAGEQGIDANTRQKGKTICWGLSNPRLMENLQGVTYIKTHHFDYGKYLRSYGFSTRLIYRLLYNQNSINRCYRIYHYEIKGATRQIGA
jgi:O-methyltransferase involved in polyketide biosynthesis